MAIYSSHGREREGVCSFRERGKGRSCSGRGSGQVRARSLVQRIRDGRKQGMDPSENGFCEDLSMDEGICGML